jgi:hypothetical protein
MLNPRRFFATAETAILSLDVQGKRTAKELAQPSQFNLLVRHLLGRFFNNEMISIGGEALPLIMTVAGVIAVPTLIVTILLFPAYHAFPPHPPIPGFWTQVGEHYFFVMYSFVAMGALTVFEADLLFPNSLDILILSTLPIANRRLVLARVSAVLIFLFLLLLGMNSLGVAAYPLMTELNVPRLLLAHLAAVLMAGLFSAALFVALQGMMICALSGRMYRLASTALQGIAMAVLLGVLFLFLPLFRSVEVLVHLNVWAARCFPPFWFLGVYESLLAGPSSLPGFARLAHTGCWATGAVLAVAIATYPLAYRRRTRHAIEDSTSRHADNVLGRPIAWLLHRTVLRTPPRRAVYHFISQTLRTQRHRVYLAMYAGLGVALMAACVVVLKVGPEQVGFGVSSYGLRLAVPGVAFWTIAGLCTALASPADPSAGWVFRVVDGKPTFDQLEAVRIWVVVWGTVVTMAAVALLHWVAPRSLRSLSETAVQIFVGVGLCVLLTDAFLFDLRLIPFTEARVPLNTDLAFVLLRYIVAFPLLVLMTVRWEAWMEARAGHLLAAAVAVSAVHEALSYGHRRIVANRTSRPDINEPNGLIQTLGLRG